MRINQLLVSTSLTNQYHFHPGTAGTQVGKVVYHRWPVLNTIATDLKEGMALGYHQCSVDNILRRNRILEFRTQAIQRHPRGPAKFPTRDAFGVAHFSPTALVPPGPPPSIAPVGTPTELRRRISAILVSSFFHPTNEKKQREPGEHPAALLDPHKCSCNPGGHKHCSTPDLSLELLARAVIIFNI